jgi:RNA polymerase sigma-70 factor (ECF subfamily)
MLYAVCLRLTGTEADAADATQEALIAIVRALPRFQRESRFSTWAYRIAVNAALDELRRRRRRPQPGIEDGTWPVAGALQTGDPETAIDRVDINAALRRLSPELRAAAVLRDLCALDYAEIAEVLDVPIGTVRSRIARGRAGLAAILQAGSGNQGRVSGNQARVFGRRSGEQ